MQGFSMQEEKTNIQQNTSHENNNENKVEESQNIEQSSLQACQKDLQDVQEKYIRLAADFQNYKRRIEKEQAAFRVNVQRSILRELIGVLDNFERATQELYQEQEVKKDFKAWLQGIELIEKDLRSILHKHGVKKMEIGKNFDPEQHEALMQVESDEHESGQIVSVLQKGYMINGYVLRPAHVSVAK